MLINAQDEIKKKLLEECRTIAVVGLDSDPNMPSNYVSLYLQRQGYKIVPVNPFLEEVLGEKSYPDLQSVPFKVDVVDVFRRSEAVHGIVKSAQELGIPAVWVQPGIDCAGETLQLAQENHMLLIRDA